MDLSPTNSKFIFVYGSSLDAEHQNFKNLKANATMLGKGFFSGNLYDAGSDKAGATLGGNALNYVFGKVYLLRNITKFIDLCDKEFGFDLENPQDSTYIRKLINVRMNQQSLKCWAYLYNKPTKGLAKIESGDYVYYLNYVKEEA